MLPLTGVLAWLILLVGSAETVHGLREWDNKQPAGVLNFLFMLRDSLPHPEVWKTFFGNAPAGSWRGWAHCTQIEGCRNDKVLESLAVRVVPTVPSRWCDDLVTAQVSLIRQALTDSQGAPGVPEKFVLLSDTTLPIKPFPSVHKGLLETRESSVCMRPVNEWPSAVVNGSELRLVKHSQWVVLTREDAQELVNRWPSNPELNSWDIPIMGQDGQANWMHSMNRSTFHPMDGTKSHDGRCADEEAVFALLYGTPTEKNVAATFNRSRCHTYIEWKGTFMWLHGITPRVFYKVEEDMAAAAKPATSYYFARKFAPTAEVPELLNLLLAEPVEGDRLTTNRALLDRWGEG